MGEKEESGMLRNVVVIGLVALIAAVVIFGVNALATHQKASVKQTLKDTTEQTTPNSLDTITMQDVDWTWTNKNTPQTAAYPSFTGKVPYKFVGIGSMLDIDTPMTDTPHWLVLQSSKLKLKPDTNRTRLTVTASGQAKVYANTWLRYYDQDKNPINYTPMPGGKGTFINALSNKDPKDQKLVKTANFPVPDNAVYYNVSMEAREGTQMRYDELEVALFHDED